MSTSRDRKWLVERVALNEAPPGTELTESERRRVAEMATDDDAIRAAYPKAEVVAEILRRERVNRTVVSPTGWRGAAIVAPAIAVAAAFVLVTRVGTPPPGSDGRAVEVTRLKGAALVIHRKTEDGSALLRNGDVAQAGDRLQLGLRLDRPTYAVLLSIDGRGVVTPHLPSAGEPSPARLDPGSIQMRFSYELDDAPAFERFFLVTSERTFSPQLVRQAISRLSALPADVAVKTPLDLPSGLGQLDFVLKKGDLR